MTAESPRPPIRIADHLPPADRLPAAEAAGLSTVARGLVGSEILRIAATIREMQAAGETVCNLTVGDFSPAQFRIPTRLEEAIADAFAAGQTNYPPSDGLLELRREIQHFTERGLGLTYPIESIIVAGGARPVIWAAYAAVVDPGETVLYPVPSWNNNHYTFLSQARAIEVRTGPETDFLPTAEMLRPHIGEARLLAINTPLNPTGTVLAASEVEAIARLVVDENRRRAATGARSLYLLWDQVYWTLTFGSARHHTPPELVPESAEWTIFVDGISKSFAATGLRVGWTLAAPYVAARMRDLLGHVGAWAPKPEQAATARFLADTAAIAEFHDGMIRDVRRRLDALHDGFQAMKRDGLPVDSVAPQGAIYLSARFDLVGKTIDGERIGTNARIRELLLSDAGFAVVPFQAFGLREENGWMRASVGAVSVADIEAGLPRVRAFLARAR